MSNFNIFDYIKVKLDISYRRSLWHGTAKSESENPGGNRIFENDERKNNFEFKKDGHKNSAIWNHKDSDLIHIDPNHTESNQPIPDDFSNIGSINDSANIGVIEKYIVIAGQFGT